MTKQDETLKCPSEFFANAFLFDHHESKLTEMFSGYSAELKAVQLELVLTSARFQTEHI
jgi:hypothetical protein